MRLRLKMPAQLGAIDDMVAQLRVAAEPFFNAEGLFGFEVAASEALTNIVQHAYGGAGETGNEVEATLSGDETGVTLDLVDHGMPVPLDIFAAVPRLEDIDIFAERGRGLSLIRHYSTFAEYRTDLQGNHLHLSFKTTERAKSKDE